MPRASLRLFFDSNQEPCGIYVFRVSPWIFFFFFLTRAETHGFVAGECGKHICVENTEVVTPGLCLTQRLSVSPLLCTAGQGFDALVSRALVWRCSFEAPKSYEKVNRENKNINTDTYTRTHVRTHMHTIAAAHYCRWKGLFRGAEESLPLKPEHYLPLISQPSPRIFRSGLQCFACVCVCAWKQRCEWRKQRVM